MTDALPFLEPSLVTSSVDGAAAPGTSLALAGSRCERCERVDFPRRLTCPVCDGATTDHALGPACTLAAYTSVLHPPPGALVPTPYHVGVGRFAEGVDVLGLLVVDTLEGLAAGDAIEVVAVRVEDNVSYGFRPV